jgi:hypothetical protein
MPKVQRKVPYNVVVHWPSFKPIAYNLISDCLNYYVWEEKNIPLVLDLVGFGHG